VLSLVRGLEMRITDLEANGPAAGDDLEDRLDQIDAIREVREKTRFVFMKAGCRCGH